VLDTFYLPGDATSFWGGTLTNRGNPRDTKIKENRRVLADKKRGESCISSKPRFIKMRQQREKRTRLGVQQRSEIEALNRMEGDWVDVDTDVDDEESSDLSSISSSASDVERDDDGDINLG